MSGDYYRLGTPEHMPEVHEYVHVSLPNTDMCLLDSDDEFLLEYGYVTKVDGTIIVVSDELDYDYNPTVLTTHCIIDLTTPGVICFDYGKDKE